MPRVISAVGVISQHPEGTDCYRIGGKIHPEKEEIASISEFSFSDGLKHFEFFNPEGKLIMRIENCPVVVFYKEG